ncbi:MAG: GntR family transcriptional regulator [Anaerolineae bacterium]|nr:GntR family transcriptional regulator [Anaerolineae bacterium]
MMLKRGAGAPPLYIQVSDILRRRLIDGVWEKDSLIPPEHQLCREFSVARGTVRQALDRLEQEGLLRREQGRGTFVTGIQTPRKLAGEQIGFIVPYVRDTFVPTILLGLEHGAEEQGFSVVFNHVSNSPQQQADAIVRFADQNLAGIILYPVDSIHGGPIGEMVKRGYPIVLVDRYLRDTLTDYVMSDHFGGALRATQHLISLGHRRIAFVSWRDPAVSIEHRMAGYQRALTEADIPFDPALTWEVEGYPDIAQNAFDNLLGARATFTAAFAANDQIALAIYKAARTMGLRVPHDLALVGFDNLDIAAQLDTPLTSVAQPAFDLGYRAVQLLIKRISGDVRDFQRVILPTTLIVRQSCGGGGSANR